MTSRIFTTDDQNAFAACTGDVNPIHVDPKTARNTFAGTCIVHGMHAALWAVDALLPSQPALAGFRAVKAQFQKMIPVGACAEAHLAALSDKRAKIEIRVDGMTCTTVSLLFDPADNGVPAFTAAQDAPLPARPIEKDFADIGREEGRAQLPDAGACAALFPQLSAHIGAASVAELAFLSTIVGMYAPGLHSLFSELSIALTPDNARPEGLSYKIAEKDDRLRLLFIQVCGRHVRGELRAFVRFPPMTTPPMADIARLLPSDTFKGQHALIIGGSRGIGLATAKLIATGGGRVTLTYKDGQEKAEKAAASINAFCGDGRAETLTLDVNAPLSLAPEKLAGYSSIYYFATPRIFNRAGKSFNPALFAEFTRFYVAAPAALLDAFITARGREPSLFFYPSSVAVAERPKFMTEYAMAKAAGEILCADYARDNPQLRVLCPRLPRIATDQTLTVPPVPAEDPFTVMRRELGIT